MPLLNVRREGKGRIGKHEGSKMIGREEDKLDSLD